ncbi:MULTISPECIES: RedY [Pseudoalteromonas]|uniref:RedY n=1 Tax=Pseudoalteromonas rubra TaxID=43658 RepID=A0A0L0EQM1_9GAMM|nr:MULTISPECIES: RedY [Pseudoalteromonas]ALU42658.1 RedY [Pseudoalteromonas rubra]KAF7786770.1 hypothetical protein PRUB_a1427 [Pseudoalteromonas rubra]KNC66183.1 RedY [Pseudoalteromonas rubra]MCG7560560.1 RedY [Pseudoalteromonas sp. McH1-42]MDK1311620.1 RedY [Pseudoalteromonas sp. R96]
MKLIVHKIRLKHIQHLGAFRDWVETTDYKACEQLDSVKAFAVFEASAEADAPFHFVETIYLESEQAFEQDMTTPLFQSLVSRFDEMAEVVEEFKGERIAQGYQQ